MLWNPVVIGVDGSEESSRAAAFGALVAGHLGTTARLVHAVPEYWVAVPPELGIDTRSLDRQAIEHARKIMVLSMAQLPADLTRTLECLIGSPAHVLHGEATRLNASLVVVGVKQHHGFERLMGTTIAHLVRLGSQPVLAHAGRVRPILRVLAAVDLSAAAGETIATAARWAATFGAQLRVLHVIEPVPVVPGVELGVADDQLYRSMCETVENRLRPLLQGTGAELVIRRGRSAAGILTEAKAWDANLVVTCSHGKNWMRRLVIGSTSERLLRVLPMPLLVLPAPAAADVAPVHHALAAAVAL